MPLKGVTAIASTTYLLLEIAPSLSGQKLINRMGVTTSLTLTTVYKPVALQIGVRTALQTYLNLVGAGGQLL